MYYFHSKVKGIIGTIGKVTIICGVLVALIIGIPALGEDIAIGVGLLVGIIVSSLLSGCLLLAVSEGLEALEIISGNIVKQNEEKPSNSVVNGNPKMTTDISDVARHNSNRISGRWKCPRCGEIRSDSDAFCSCGCEKPKF